MKKKWNKPTRAEIRCAIQLWLLVAMTTIGFGIVYLLLLLSVGVPWEWWVPYIAVICGGLSTHGLIRSIGRSRQWMI